MGKTSLRAGLSAMWPPRDAVLVKARSAACLRASVAGELDPNRAPRKARRSSRVAASRARPRSPARPRARPGRRGTPAACAASARHLFEMGLESSSGRHGRPCSVGRPARQVYRDGDDRNATLARADDGDHRSCRPDRRSASSGRLPLRTVSPARADAPAAGMAARSTARARPACGCCTGSGDRRGRNQSRRRSCDPLWRCPQKAERGTGSSCAARRRSAPCRRGLAVRGKLPAVDAGSRIWCGAGPAAASSNAQSSTLKSPFCGTWRSQKRRPP